jgi:hypothetical protein
MIREQLRELRTGWRRGRLTRANPGGQTANIREEKRVRGVIPLFACPILSLDGDDVTGRGVERGRAA